MMISLVSSVPLQLPDSVLQYLTDSKHRETVDSALKFGAKKLPHGLEWSRLPEYFRAALAAHRVQVEWALTLERLWRSVWPDQISGWAPVRVDGNVTIERCWITESFGRYFTRHGSPGTERGKASPDVLHLGVSITLQGAAVSISMNSNGHFKGPGAAMFEYDDEAESWWSAEQTIGSGSLDLTTLQSAARQALKSVAESRRR